jgi:hypothetical protein
MPSTKRLASIRCPPAFATQHCGTPARATVLLDHAKSIGSPAATYRRVKTPYPNAMAWSNIAINPTAKSAPAYQGCAAAGDLYKFNKI